MLTTVCPGCPSHATTSEAGIVQGLMAGEAVRPVMKSLKAKYSPHKRFERAHVDRLALETRAETIVQYLKSQPGGN
jgi:hypothetical protein